MDRAIKTAVGEIIDIFAHRFAIASREGKVLADPGPEGAERVALEVGDRVDVSGEAKPSEIKVARIAPKGGAPIEIGHEPRKDEHEAHEGDADPAVASRAVEAQGFTPVGAARRRPRHFENTGRDAAGGLVEYHVEFDGRIRRAKPARAGAA